MTPAEEIPALVADLKQLLPRLAELLPSIRVAGCDLVPPGRFWIAGRPCTEEER